MFSGYKLVKSLTSRDKNPFLSIVHTQDRNGKTLALTPASPESLASEILRLQTLPNNFCNKI